NIKCYVFSGPKKLLKEARKINGIDSWITLWADDFVFKIDIKINLKLLEYNIENNESNEEIEFEIIEVSENKK
ncbi:7079_t:CDS:2, partial [Cetraspora pellucida]